MKCGFCKYFNRKWNWSQNEKYRKQILKKEYPILTEFELKILANNPNPLFKKDIPTNDGVCYKITDGHSFEEYGLNVRDSFNCGFFQKKES